MKLLFLIYKNPGQRPSPLGLLFCFPCLPYVYGAGRVLTTPLCPGLSCLLPRTPHHPAPVKVHPRAWGAVVGLSWVRGGFLMQSECVLWAGAQSQSAPGKRGVRGEDRKRVPLGCRGSCVPLLRNLLPAVLGLHAPEQVRTVLVLVRVEVCCGPVWHNCDPRTQKAEREGRRQCEAGLGYRASGRQPSLHSETWSQKLEKTG